MKRNRIFILFAAVLILTLVSTSLVAGTYAKYTKAVTGTDTARVAKFAFNLTDGENTANQASADPVTINLFDTSTDTGVYTGGVGADGKKLVAPGTTGNVLLSVDNLSEVDITVAFALTETNTNNVPIYYTIGTGTQRYSAVLTGGYGEGADTYLGLAELASAVGGTVQASNGTDAVSLSDITLNWTYAFNSAGTQQTDTEDTALGIAGTAIVELEVTCTVTQVD